MNNILYRLIYGIEGYEENPDLVITKFERNPNNPKKYIVEIEDRKETKQEAENAGN